MTAELIVPLGFRQRPRRINAMQLLDGVATVGVQKITCLYSLRKRPQVTSLGRAYAVDLAS
jgi:hypothetical protein